MIKYFTVENYKSIKNECILEFDNHLGKDSPFITSPVVGFAGANASGKTNILQAITFVFWFMKSSFFDLKKGELIPFSKFVSLPTTPTRFHSIFSIKLNTKETCKEVDFEYILVLDQEQIFEEILNYYPLGRKREAYTRNLNKLRFGNSITKLKAEEIRDLRSNSSLTSFLSMFDSQEIALTCSRYNLVSNLGPKGLNGETFHFGRSMKYFSSDAYKRNALEFILSLADIGIKGFELQRFPFLKININESDSLNHDLSSSIEPSVNQQNVLISWLGEEVGGSAMIGSDSYARLPIMSHNIDDSKVDFPANEMWESSGTLELLSIFSRVHSSLAEGALMIVDEIELKLHQDLVAYLIGLFQNPEQNPHGAQLIFSFHNSSFMEILEPQQLWFTEKNDQGQTEIFSAADFKDIKQLHKKNLEKLYRIGRFGAKPRGL